MILLLYTVIIIILYYLPMTLLFQANPILDFNVDIDIDTEAIKKKAEETLGDIQDRVSENHKYAPFNPFYC